MIKYFTLIIAALLLSSNLYSQEEWKLTGQVQLRSELDGRDFSNQTHPLTFASLRTRVGVEKTFAERVNFFVQVQDSRVFGEEASITSNSANLDLHQGYVKLINLFDWDWSVQAGRFVVSYGTERFLGAGDWNYIGRAWDGVRFGFNPGFKLDLFGLTQKEPVDYVNFASPAIYYPSEPTPSRSLYGFYAGWSLSEMSKFDLIGYYDVFRATNEKDELALKRFNVSGSYYGNYSQFSTVVEAGYQFGKQYGEDISAYLLSLQGLFDVKPLKLGLGVDILSGSETSTGTNTFTVPYATNHKFYGFMDYFNGAPNGGLNDFYLMAFLNPTESNLSGSLYLHHFTSNKDVYSFVTLKSYKVYGQELDLTLKYSVVQNTYITWGGSLFFPVDLMNAVFATGNDTAFWTYLMITASL